MAEVRVLLALAALVAVALFCTEKGVRSSLAPLTAVAGTGLWFAFMGCLDLLAPGGWIWYTAAAAAAGWLVWRYAIKKQAMPRLSFGFWFFVGASLLLILLLWARRPLFTEWDEFSTWGTSAKLTKINNLLYSTAPVGWPWAATQPPFLMVFGYFVQFLGKGFLPWQTYAAYNIIYMACIAALCAPFEGEKGGWNIALPTVVSALLLPYLILHYGVAQRVSPVYLDSLADLPLGFLFGGALACWYGGRKTGRDLLALCLALAALTLTKDTGVLLALVVAALVFFDLLLQRGAKGAGKKSPLPPLWAGAGPRLQKRFLRALSGFGIAAGSALAAFFTWSAYLSLGVNVNRFNLGGPAQMGMLEMPLAFVREMFSPQKSAKFVEVMQGMARLFLHSRITLLGSGAMVAALTLAMVGLAALITKNAVHRRRCLVFAGFSGLGFALYYLFIAMSYIYLLKPSETFFSYERYVYPYYIGWFLAALLLLGISAVSSRFMVEGRLGVLALALLLLLRVGQHIPVQFTPLGLHASEYDERRAFEADVAALTAQLPPDSRTFFVSSSDTGFGWFIHSYEFLPQQLDYSFGGGILAQREIQPDGSVLEQELTAAEWGAYLTESGCTHIYILDADDAFVQRYGVLFSDGMAAYLASGTQLYTVNSEGGQVTLNPMP